jgi:hypothetical protein
MKKRVLHQKFQKKGIMITAGQYRDSFSHGHAQQPEEKLISLSFS